MLSFLPVAVPTKTIFRVSMLDAFGVNLRRLWTSDNTGWDEQEMHEQWPCNVLLPTMQSNFFHDTGQKRIACDTPSTNQMTRMYLGVN